MKNTPAVFLTSLAVSAISLTVPMPAATTVLDLFIGEEIAVQDPRQNNCESRQNTHLSNDGATKNSTSDWESNKHLRELPEQRNTISSESEAAFPLISNFCLYYTMAKRVLSMSEDQLAASQHRRSLLQM